MGATVPIRMPKAARLAMIIVATRNRACRLSCGEGEFLLKGDSKNCLNIEYNLTYVGEGRKPEIRPSRSRVIEEPKSKEYVYSNFK